MDKRPYKLPEQYLKFQIFQKHQKILSEISPKEISVNFNSLTLEDSARNLAHLFKLWEKGFPLYCVRPSLLEDMMLTDVGENLALFNHIELEVPCFALFFPHGKVRSPHHGVLNYLIVQHEQIDTVEHKHLIFWGGIDSEERMIVSSKKIRKDGTLLRSQFSNNDKSMQEKVLAIRNIVLQSILLLQYYPHIVSDCQPSSGKGFGQNSKNESQYRLPRWLGEESRSSQKADAEKGKGKGKCTHFRRGHWRLIKEKKLVYVRPAWVNPTIKLLS
jgi:hypothetical protein